MIFAISVTGGFTKQLKVSNESNGEFYSNSTSVFVENCYLRCSSNGNVCEGACSIWHLITNDAALQYTNSLLRFNWLLMPTDFRKLRHTLQPHSAVIHITCSHVWLTRLQPTHDTGGIFTNNRHVQTLLVKRIHQTARSTRHCNRSTSSVVTSITRQQQWRTYTTEQASLI